MFKTKLLIMFLVIAVLFSACKKESNEEDQQESFVSIIIGSVVIIIGLFFILLSGSECPYYLAPEYHGDRWKCKLLRTYGCPEDGVYDKYCIKYKGEKKMPS